MRIETLPIFGPNAAEQPNPKSEEEAPVEGDSFFFMVIDRMKAMLCGRLRGAGGEDIPDLKTARGGLREDPEAAAEPPHPAGTLHVQDFAASDTLTIFAVPEVLVEDALSACDSKSPEPFISEPAVSTTLSEVVFSAATPDVTLASAPLLAEASDLPQSALPGMDSGAGSEGIPLPVGPFPGKPAPVPNSSMELMNPAMEVEGTADPFVDIKPPADARIRERGRQPAAPILPSPAAKPQDRPASATQVIPAEIGEPADSGRTVREPAPPMIPVTEQEAAELPAIAVRDVAKTRDPQPSVRMAPEPAPAESRWQRAAVAHASEGLPESSVPARHDVEPAASELQPGPAAGVNDPAKLRDLNLAARHDVEAAWSELRPTPFTSAPESAKLQDPNLPAPGAVESADAASRPDPSPAVHNGTDTQTPRLPERNAVEPTLSFDHPDGVTEKRALPPAREFGPPVRNAVGPTSSFEYPDGLAEQHFLPPTREFGLPARNAAVAPASSSPPSQAAMAAPASSETAELSNLQPAPPILLQPEELVGEAFRVSVLPTDSSERQQAPDPQISVRDHRETPQRGAEPLRAAYTESSGQAERQGAAPEREMPVIQRGPLPVDVQASSIRDNSPQSRSPRRRVQETNGREKALQLPPQGAESRRVAQMLNAGIPILPEPGKPQVATKNPENASSAILQPDDDPKTTQAASRQKLSADNAEAAQQDKQAAAAPPPQASPIRSVAKEAGSHPLLRSGETVVFRPSAPAAGATQQPSPPTAAEFKALSALLAPRPSGGGPEPDFLTQLAERFQAQLREGENVLRIQLKPSSLGRLEIRAETSGSGLVATILTETAAVREYLEHNLHVLQQSFQDQGLKVDRIQIGVQEGFWLHHPSAGHQESRSQGERHDDAGASLWHHESGDPTGAETASDPLSLAVLKPHSTFHTVA